MTIEVLQGTRGAGKTTKLIQWLMHGEQTNAYPGWSRGIVCVDNNRVRNTTVMLKKASQKLLDNFRVSMHVMDDDKGQRELRAIHDMRKCVWSLEEFQRRWYSFDNMEYAIDDFDKLLVYLLRAKCPPAIVTGSNFALTLMHGGADATH